MIGSIISGLAVMEINFPLVKGAHELCYGVAKGTTNVARCGFVVFTFDSEYGLL